MEVGGPETQGRNSITQRKRNSFPNSSRNTPQTPQEKKEEADSTEIAVKIQQIKEQVCLKRNQTFLA